jgi:ribosome-associated protein
MTDLPDTYDNDRLLWVNAQFAIPRAELQFRTSRSGGPGGQHVNKVETKVELLFDVANSNSLTDDLRQRLLLALKPWLDSDGVLHLVSEAYRSQYRNREDVIARFVLLLQHALRPKKTRRPTRIPRAVHEQRLQSKKHRSEIKRSRGRARGNED